MPSDAVGLRARRGTRRWAPITGWAAALVLIRRHWLVTALLTVGLALRVMTALAYRPALLYIDSIKYLFGAYPGNDPPGYQLMLAPLVGTVSPAVMAGAQHVLGLGIAVTIYVLLLRRGAPRWLAALATAPVLLDAYQLQIEQTIMPDVVFEALITAGLAALLWHRRPRVVLIAVAGLALGASATVREIGEIFLLPGLLFLLLALPRWRTMCKGAAIFAVAFALPILGASYRDAVALHHFGLAPYAGGTIYGRFAEAADCATLKLASYERPLCPTPAQQRMGPDWLDHSHTSPVRTYVAPPGHSRSQAVSGFDRRVLTQQPLRVLSLVGKDALKLFALQRIRFPGDAPINRWQFQTSYPQYPPYVAIHGKMIYFAQLSESTGQLEPLGTSRLIGGGPPVVVHPLASFLRSYQLGGGYTPGPLFLIAVLAGAAGSAMLLRRRLDPARRDAALACLLVFAAGVSVLLVSDAFEFTWRYQLPALVTIIPAGALGLVALGVRERRTTTASAGRAQWGSRAAVVPAVPDGNGALGGGGGTARSAQRAPSPRANGRIRRKGGTRDAAGQDGPGAGDPAAQSAGDMLGRTRTT